MQTAVGTSLSASAAQFIERNRAESRLINQAEDALKLVPTAFCFITSLFG